jgi:hypothetical protein
MTILSVTGESKEIVDPFVEELEPIYPILCQGGGQVHEYSTGGVPTSYLIGADGTVLWHGHPGKLEDDLIEKHLKDVEKAHRVSTWAFMIKQALPELPDKLGGIMKLLEKMKFGAALKKVESTLPKLEGDDQEAGEKVRAWIEEAGTKGIEKAAGLVRDGKVYKGVLEYEIVEERFKGHDLSKQAKNAVKEVKKDKALALEIKASEKFEKIKKDMAEERKPEDKLKCLKPLLSKKYADTLAGREAARIAEELESKIEK